MRNLHNNTGKGIMHTDSGEKPSSNRYGQHFK